MRECFGVRRHIGSGARLEVIAEVCVLLVANFLSRRFAAVLGDAPVVFHAHAADVQLPATRRTFIEATQGQGQRRKGRAAFPADEIVGHRAAL